MSLRKILEEVYMRGYGYDLKEVSVDQAHQEILALLPKKKEKDFFISSNWLILLRQSRKEQLIKGKSSKNWSSRFRK